MRNISILAKILIPVAIMTALLVMVSYLGYHNSEGILVAVDDMYNGSAKPAMWILDAKSYAIRSRRLASGMLEMRLGELDEAENMVKESGKRIDDLFEQYLQSGLSPQEETLFGGLREIRASVEAMQDEIAATAKAQSRFRMNEMAARMKQGGDIAQTEDRYIAEFDALAQLLVRKADDLSASVVKTSTQATLSTVIISVVAIVAGMALGIFTARIITVSVRRTGEAIVSFSDGDLTSSFETRGKDEIALMGRNLHKMGDNLTRIILSVKGASHEIADTAQDFSALAEETNASVEEFRANVEDMGSHLDVLAATSEKVHGLVGEVSTGAQATAEKGTDIARRVDEAMEAGENGMTSVRRAVESIDGVAGNASEAAKSIQDLGTRTQQIQGFVARIGGIATQTNLLALNAAIEAARAGDAGRGFAVVADEVRKLAEDSNVAAKNIEELAGTITGDIDRVVAISLDNARASEDARELSRRTEGIIASMLDHLKEIANATQDLAAVSQEQAASSEEITESIQNITAMANNTADVGEHIRSGVVEVSSAAERMAQGAEGLSGLADNLREILVFFRTGEDDEES